MEFLRIASEEEKKYFLFSTVRNPLDEVVSRDYRLKHDHKSAFSDPEAVRKDFADYSDLRKYEFVRANDASFASFFQRFHRWPFGGWIDVSRPHLHFVMRFEDLDEDFSRVLKLLNIPQIRPLPTTNASNRPREWEDLYSGDIEDQARRVFGPFVRRWDYEFPSHWGKSKICIRDRAADAVVSWLRRTYALRFRFSHGTVACVVRRLRASI